MVLVAFGKIQRYTLCTHLEYFPYTLRKQHLIVNRPARRERYLHHSNGWHIFTHRLGFHLIPYLYLDKLFSCQSQPVHKSGKWHSSQVMLRRLNKTHLDSRLYMILKCLKEAIWDKLHRSLSNHHLRYHLMWDIQLLKMLSWWNHCCHRRRTLHYIGKPLDYPKKRCCRSSLVSQ